jgi:pimeloyl-ACP methyl ester carboxylesterase
MLTIDRGTGEPLILIPGLQGRWEYMRPAVDALARSHRVITFSLGDEPSACVPFDLDHRGLDGYVAHIEAVLNNLKIDRAAICGVSFGGLIALRCAATMTERTSALVLASTPGPRFHLKKRHRLYSRVPWLFGPLFAAESPARLRRELSAALPDERERRQFINDAVKTFREAPLSAPRMARRALLIESYDRFADCVRVTCPTLVVHGDPSLDFVVDASETANYGHLISGARVVMMERTGHLGSVTQPQRFADIVGSFLDSARKDSQHSAA